ncbi:MAG: hypothetical protein CBB87_01815 [Micavibrio sp. TMED27]|nr:hypothetical protein [Micavibrio sp.]OUT92500.1 MAG: hypothetical protein CBB87_01815 [Micavibrio sp. TMED27]
MKNIKKQSGNVLFLILIGVALFASLTFVVGNMLRSSGAEQISEEKVKLYVTDVLNYGRQMKQVVSDMRISNNCSDMDISFTRASGDAYEHSPAAPDICKAFHPSGGSMGLFRVKEDILVDSTSVTKSTGYGDIHFSGDADIDTIGTACSDGSDSECRELLLLIPYLKQQVCDEINTQLNISGYAAKNINEHDYLDADKFKGYYATDGNASIGFGSNELDGKAAGCFSEPDHPSYTFYQVLIAR